MARKKGCEHGQMLYSADGYVTAWFMWQLKSDQNAAKAFVGSDAEIKSKGPGERYIILLHSIRGMACVSYHGVMISLPEIFAAKRLIFIEKNVKNAIKSMTFDRYLGILTQFSKLLLFLHT